MKGRACARRRAWVSLSDWFMGYPVELIAAFYLKFLTDGIIQRPIVCRMCWQPRSRRSALWQEAWDDQRRNRTFDKPRCDRGPQGIRCALSRDEPETSFHLPAYLERQNGRRGGD